MEFRSRTLILLVVPMIVLSAIAQNEATQTLSFTGLFKQINANSRTLTEGEQDFYDTWDEYITLFFKGAKVIPKIKDTEACINSTRDFSKAMGTSFKNIQEKGLDFDTYLESAKAVGEAQPAIKTCYDPQYTGITNIHEWLGHFKSTLGFIEKLFLNMAYSFYRWFEISKSFMEAFGKSDYKKISYVSGRAAQVLFDFDADLKNLNTNSELENIKSPLDILKFFEFLSLKVLTSIFDFSYNFLDGALILESDKVEICEDTISSYKKSGKEAIEEIKKNTDEGIKTGVFIIADMLGKYHEVNEVCVSGVQTGIDRIHEYMRIRTAPIEILYNFIWNYRKIYKHMMQNVECLFTGDVRCIGFQTGSLVYQIFAKH